MRYQSFARAVPLGCGILILSSLAWIGSAYATTSVNQSQISAVKVPGYPTYVALDATSAWSSDMATDTVSRIDVSTGRVVGTVRLKGIPANLGVAGKHVWIVLSTMGLVEIDPVTNRVAKFIAIPGIIDESLATTPTRVIVGTSQGNRVLIFSATSGARQGAVAIGTTPMWIASGASGVYVSSNRGTTIKQIDPATRKVTRSIVTGLPGAVERLTLQGAYLWFTTTSNSPSGGMQLWRLIISSGALRQTPLPFDTYGIAGNGADLWVVSTGNQIGEVYEASGAYAGTLNLTGSAWGLVARGNEFAVGVRWNDQVDLFSCPKVTG